jgi:hypothetical protein
MNVPVFLVEIAAPVSTHLLGTDILAIVFPDILVRFAKPTSMNAAVFPVPMEVLVRIKSIALPVLVLPDIQAPIARPISMSARVFPVATVEHV